MTIEELINHLLHLSKECSDGIDTEVVVEVDHRCEHYYSDLWKEDIIYNEENKQVVIENN